MLCRSATELGPKGWRFTGVDKGLGQGGHRVTWQLDWDSSKVTNTAALDRTIRVYSKDRGSLRNIFKWMVL